MLHLYAPEIDLSPLNSSTTPQLQQVLFSGATETLTAPSLSHTFAFDVEVEEVGQINVPLSAKKKGNLTLRNYNSRALVHTSLDHEYLRSQFASVYGLAVSLPPSKYLPHPDEREIWFVFNILDFSGEQWRGFKGLVYFQRSCRPRFTHDPNRLPRLWSPHQSQYQRQLHHSQSRLCRQERPRGSTHLLCFRWPARIIRRCTSL